MDTVFKLSPVALAVIAFSASAQEIETVEVTGHQLQGVDAVVTADDLSKQQALDLNDVFRKNPEVTVGGSSGITQKIYVRGLEDSQLNVTIDGAVQSGKLFHHQGRLAIEPDLLKQVEVSAGAGRATNGPGALGGAIKFETKDAHDLLIGSEKWGTKVKAGYLSNTDGYKGNVNVYGEVSEGLGLLGSFTYFDKGNIVDGHGNEQEYTAVEQSAGLLKLSGQVDEKNYISLGYDVSIDHNFRAHRPEWSPQPTPIGRYSNPVFKQEMDRFTTTANHKYTGSDYINLDTTIYQTKVTIAHNHPVYGLSEGDMNTFGGEFKNSAYLGNHHLITGFDYRDDEGEFNSGGTKYNENGTVLGLFLQNDWQAAQRLLITFGARYDWYDLEQDDGKNFDASGFSPNVGAELDVTDNIKLFTSYAEAIRGPVVKQIFYLEGGSNDVDLEKEEAKNFEFGANFQYSYFEAGITAFNSEIDNVVYASRGAYANGGLLENKGFSAYLDFAFENLHANVSYNESSPTLNGEPLSDQNRSLGTVIGDTWVLDLSYAANHQLDFGWTSTFVERVTEVQDPSVDPEKPGYAVHDLYAQWRPLANERLQLTLSIKNVFDKFYRDHGTYGEYLGYQYTQGNASPGRDIRLSASYAF